MADLKKVTIQILHKTSDLAHIVISMALITAAIIIAIFFFHEVYAALEANSLIKGFLHALGILLLLWTMVELINTKIRYLNGEGIDVAIFIEVALVVMVREIIMLPVEKPTLDFIDIGMWTGGAVLLGLTYLMIRIGQYYAKKNS
jgi:uncharacterized membrane protein (DUF373 family)